MVGPTDDKRGPEAWGGRYTHRPDFYDWNDQNRPNVVNLFNRLGYNLYNSEDVTRLGENLRFSEESRRRYEAIKTRRLGWIVSLSIALMGAFLTSVGQWVANHVK